ncbi:terpenoid synthase [Lactarius quietus]|nr:terpenoid synthase [Lactarius quietus]
MPEGYYIPKVLENWKWPRIINPHRHEAQEATEPWVRHFEEFTPKAQAAYDRCDIYLLTALSYPFHDKARLRTGCSFMFLTLVYDEYSDTSNEDEVQVMADAMMDALRNPHTPRPKGEWVGGEIARQFWELAIETASPQSQTRFIETYGAYAQAVVQEAADRGHKRIRSVQEYFDLRRVTLGARPSFALIELDKDLPDEAVRHPVVEEITILTVDMISLSNDIFSYNVEQSRGDDGHNIITVVMHQDKTDIQGAIDWVYDYYKAAVAKFMDLYENKIPKFGEPVDTELAQYVDGMAIWVRSNYQWSFESERYFGKKGPEIEQTRWVNLLPKQNPSPEYIVPVLVDIT